MLPVLLESLFLLAGTMIVTGGTARIGGPTTQIGTGTIPAGMAAAGMMGTPAEGTMLGMTGVTATKAAMTADAAAVQQIGIDIDPTPGTDKTCWTMISLLAPGHSCLV